MPKPRSSKHKQPEKADKPSRRGKRHDVTAPVQEYQWGPPIFDTQYQLYYRERIDEYGKIIPEWIEDGQEAAEDPDRETPRSHAEGLPRDFQALGISNIEGIDYSHRQSNVSQHRIVSQGPVSSSEHSSSPQYTHAVPQGYPFQAYANEDHGEELAGQHDDFVAEGGDDLVSAGNRHKSRKSEEPANAHEEFDPYDELTSGDPQPPSGRNPQTTSAETAFNATEPADPYNRAPSAPSELDPYDGLTSGHPQPLSGHNPQSISAETAFNATEPADPYNRAPSAPSEPGQEPVELEQHSRSKKGKEKLQETDWNEGRGSALPTRGAHTEDVDESYPNVGIDSGDDGEGDFAKAVDESRQTAYIGQQSGGPSTASRLAYHIAPATSSDMYEQTHTHDQTYYNPKHLIVGRGGEYEEADPHTAKNSKGYKVEQSWRFHPGAVFKILWSEPAGAVTIADDVVSDVRKIDSDFYVSYRRFIVVATDEGHHSTCVPILTYEQKGCKKKGVKPLKHGIVYSDREKPRLLRDEPTLGYPPVMLTMSVVEKLARESRVNYSKLVTIEHNVKVFFIGTIEGHDFATVQRAVNECWEMKEQRQTAKHLRTSKKSKKR
ncbi:hypothetical protein BJ170DRAFT_712449 [Xylariales sp. AK1849]|nr:hypothetical protein BJ170DRAFT_712449 [Xylariales sp. AK1849]